MNNELKRFDHKFTSLIKARFPLIYIPSYEEERVVQVIQSLLQNPTRFKSSKPLFQWTATGGFLDQTGQSRFTPDTKDPLRALTAIEHFPEPALFVLKDFHVFMAEHSAYADTAEVIRKLRDMLIGLKQRGKHILFLSPSLILPVDLQKDVYLLAFDLPNYQELRQLLLSMIEVNRKSGRITVDLSDHSLEMLVKAAQGLTLQEAENTFALAMATDGRLDLEDFRIIIGEKRQIIQKSGILEYVDHDCEMSDVGGLDRLKLWLRKRDKSWLNSAQDYGLPAPKGVLITGVPGCGKSLIAKAISATWQLPLLRFDIGKIFSSYLGASEENMRRALQTVEAIAPAILWVDEIEKGFSGTNNTQDSGASSRVFSTFLTWMQEKSSSVFVVATANDIEVLPPELLRKGRFDEIFYVDLPTMAERVAIFKIHLGKRLAGKTIVSPEILSLQTYETLAGMTEGFIGSEIEQSVINALYDAYWEERKLCMDDLVKSIQAIIPLSITQADQIEAIREWAKTRAVLATDASTLQTVG